MIDLKDLAFTVDDFRYIGPIDTPQEMSGVGRHYNMHPDQAADIAEWANKILADKLAKAPVVTTTRVLSKTPFPELSWSSLSKVDDVCCGVDWATHQARLVLVEEVGK